MARSTSQINVEIDDEMEYTNSGADQNHDNEKRPTSGCLQKAGQVVAVVVVLTACLVALPFWLVWMAGRWFFCGAGEGNEVWMAGRWFFCGAGQGNESPETDDGAEKSLYLKTMEGIENTAKRVPIPVVIRSRLVILFLAWFLVNLSFPELRKKDIQGSHLWKWTFLLGLVLCGYHFISLFTRLVKHVLKWNGTFDKNSDKVEYYIKGLRRSVSLVLYSAMLLVAWVIYFRTSHGIKRTAETKDVLHIGTWTLVTLAVVSILWLLKNVLLLIWRANAVYSRFRRRILKTGSMCYFLGHIYGSKVGIFKPPDHNKDGNNKDDTPDDHQYAGSSTNSMDKQGEKPMNNQEQEKENEEKAKAQNILLVKEDATINLHNITKMSRYFVQLSKCSRKDDGTSDVLSRCRKIRYSDRSTVRVEDFEEFDLYKTDAQTLFETLMKLKEGPKSDGEISYKHFEKSMVKAHKNCVELGHTLVDAIAVVNVLDTVMTLVLAVIAIVAWLLLTDLASTKILVFLATPLLGATFVFGETAKKIFEGIIFTFINHPFDIGDKCIIHETELEVKRMNILATIFTVIGTKEEVVYPNSMLASMSITNLKGEPDPNDQAELMLDLSYTTPMLKELEDKIIKFFKDDNGNSYTEDINVVVNDVGENSIKMAIQYQHVFSINETTHSQCLEKKMKQRSHLLMKLMQLTEETNERKARRSISIA